MKKTNNKGFSLVELIIVIAIMAVLVGILAPQFIQYVERSKQSTDIKNVQEMVAAMQVYAADTTATGYPNGTIALTGDPASDTTITNALTNAGLPATYDAASKLYENTIITVVAGTNGDLTFSAGVTGNLTSQNAAFGF